MRSVSVVFTCVALLAGCASNSGTNESPQETEARRYSPDGGGTPVGVIPDARLRDDQRNKDLDLFIEYPTRGGPYPVVILSHGFGGSKTGYGPLTSHWASNGYVVIRPTHADSGALRVALSQQKEESAGRSVRERLDTVETVWESQTATDWENRVRDVGVIIDSLASLEERYPELRGRIDTTRVGVGGHSYGALTALLIGGVRSASIPRPTADSRVRAVLAMSPPGTSSRLGLTRESFSELKPPTLFLTGTEDRGTSEQQTAAWRREGFDFSPAGDKYLIVIQGARHATFTGRMLPPREEVRMPDTGNPNDPRRLDPSLRPQRSGSMGDPLRERNLFGVAKITTLAFWDAHLKGEPEGKAYLGRVASMGAEVKTK